ncbi:hypothetical protein pdul_cds_373 [Pandoravirus dulcis]|uniref:F-box incomplete domain containing protein n=1 Tax=Pandoravirus dulcis TaxID=1349409 RepID=A0A291AU78_9VIRU|nr:hypothetical protein pdul_cds_373 [Pandoravirus dulcis]ATE82497.1 hypothetical protein pdul_cds_373 [Pandoravirus dulcis]
MRLDELPPEILVAMLAHVSSTADLARLAAVSVRLAAVARAVRATRAQRRGKRGPHADPVGCAHAIVNAIASDDAVGMVDALDVGSVGLSDGLDIDYLQAVAVPNVYVVVMLGPLARDCLTVVEYARESIGCTQWDALGVAVIHGSAACVRALVALGARTDQYSLDRLIDFVLTRIAWRRVRTHMAYALSPVIHARSSWPRVARPRLVDPVAVLSPLVEVHCGDDGRLLRAGRALARPFNHLATARESLVLRVWPDFTANAPSRYPADEDYPVRADVMVDDARRLVALLLAYGCRPDHGIATDAQDMAERWRAVVLGTRHPPSPEQVAAWRASALLVTEHERALLWLERARMAACDRAPSISARTAHGIVVVRDVLAAIVDAYDHCH